MDHRHIYVREVIHSTRKHFKQREAGDGAIQVSPRLVRRHCPDRRHAAAFGRRQGRAPYFVHQRQAAHHGLLVPTLLTVSTTHILHTNNAKSASASATI
jgi:hypothetical protein